MITVLKASVLAGEDKETREKRIDEASKRKPCTCSRFIRGAFLDLPRIQATFESMSWTGDAGHLEKRIRLDDVKAPRWQERARLSEDLDTIGALLEKDEHDATIFWAVRYQVTS
jgi:hypothetical protein